MTTTHYVLDPGAGLTQVLADGTNTYLYGNDRLAQYQTAMQYFGADGLGSVRQIYDASGQVVGSTRYDPYGNVMAQSGTASSAYGYAGEQYDTGTGLEYLRARYYSSAQGRFTTRDVWEGDPNAPLSYNAWLYALGNPVRLTDPTGLTPTEAGIKGDEYSYTCNCGWVDYTHASPRAARQLIEEIYYDLPTGRNSFQPFTDRKAVLFGEYIGAFGMQLAGVEDFAVVKTPLNDAEKNRVALGIFENLSDRFESWQENSLLAESGFAEEDLVSNLIGFYLALDDFEKFGFGSTLEKKQVRDLVRATCGVPNDPKDDNADKRWSLSVLEEYGPFQKVKTWENPRLKCSSLIDGSCGLNRQWPAQYASIRPEPPSTDGKWWWWRGLQDGELMRSDKEGVYYVVPWRVPWSTQ